MARSSIGKDYRFSTCQEGSDSPTGYWNRVLWHVGTIKIHINYLYWSTILRYRGVQVVSHKFSQGFWNNVRCVKCWPKSSRNGFMRFIISEVYPSWWRGHTANVLGRCDPSARGFKSLSLRKVFKYIRKESEV